MKTRILLIALSFLLSATATSAKVTVPSVIGDGMVLQRNTQVALWGKAAPKSTVKITTSWNGEKYKTTTDSVGQWFVKVSTGDAGGPYSIKISDGEPLTIENVLLGEVWVCSGQSNMEMPICGFTYQPVEAAAKAVTDATQYPGIRMYTVPLLSSETPVGDNPSAWQTSSPAAVSSFSAVAYFFGKQLYSQLGVPVGLINTSWGGSAIEAWMTVGSIDQTEGIDHKIAKSGTSPNSIPQRLYNGMIVPISNFTAKGFIWYQGESNRHNWFDYCELQASMVELWRKSWDNDTMPFYFTQLAPYNYEGKEKLSLPLTIEAQYQAAERIPHSGIAATTDIGNPVCIHPAQKQEVGVRLAYLALANDYGIEGLPAPAPTYNSMARDGAKIVLSFNNISGQNGFKGRDSFVWYGPTDYVTLSGFEIAGEDRVFHPANANFKGWENKIEVSSPEVSEPVAVRYAFHNYAPEANVTTTMGQPLAPFRTDSWEADNIW
jgi:sialate O-acetylesterase